MDNKYITVLDFEIARIFQYKIDENDIPIGVTIHEWYEDFLMEKGHRLSNIEWMEHDDNRVIVQTPHGEIKQLQRDYDMVESIKKDK